jgi:hypothetical protein
MAHLTDGPGGGTLEWRMACEVGRLPHFGLLERYISLESQRSARNIGNLSGLRPLEHTATGNISVSHRQDLSRQPLTSKTRNFRRMKALLRVLSIVSLTLLAMACVKARPVSFFDNPMPLLVWFGQQTRPAGAAYPPLPSEPKFGSISGLAPDAASEQWIAAIDDRERTRVAWLRVSYSADSLTVTPTRMQELRPGRGVDPRIVTQADLEAIVALPKGGFVLSEEGHIGRDGKDVWQPVLLRMTGDGVVTHVITYPKQFQITSDGTSGPHPNQGFEGLAVTPGGRLIAGLEQPLIEDGLTTYDRPAPGRLVEFVPSGSTFKPGKQWRYMISPTPRVEGFETTCSDGENGLVELLALSETTLISMERSCQVSADKQFTANTVMLFSVDLVGAEARKRLLLDFKDLDARLRPVLPRLENFEGMTFGPIVNGTKTLLIASDDNFRPTQKMSFLLFGMR